jgi:hypothetical protein
MEQVKKLNGGKNNNKKKTTECVSCLCIGRCISSANGAGNLLDVKKKKNKKKRKVFFFQFSCECGRSIEHLSRRNVSESKITRKKMKSIKFEIWTFSKQRPSI